MKRHAPRLHPCEVEHIVDHAGEMSTVAQHDFQVFLHFGWQLEGVDLGRPHDELHQANDHVQRCAEFVAHLGHKRCLRFLGVLRDQAQGGHSLAGPAQLLVGVRQVCQGLFQLHLALPCLCQQMLHMLEILLQPYASLVEGAVCGRYQTDGGPDRCQCGGDGGGAGVGGDVRR